MKIQTQAALLFTFLTGLITLFLSLTIYFFAYRFTYNDFLKRLELRAVVASKLRFEENRISIAAYNELRRQYLEVLPQEKEYVLHYEQVRKKPGDSGLPLPVSYYESIARANGKTVFTKVGAVHYAGILYTNESKSKYLVIKSAVNVYGTTILKNLQNTLAITFIASVIVIFSVSFFYSYRTFAPVRKITARARSISVHNLHLRLEVKKGQDEMVELAQTFNDMLDRLETAFETQNNFVSNASHELRTPLTTIIGEADIALAKSATVEEYRQSLQVITTEAQKLQHLTNSLLNLAQTGFDGKKFNRVPVRIDELLWTVKQTIDQINPGNQLQISLQELPDDHRQLYVTGNYHLLKLALSNIVGNACKYSGNKPVDLLLQTAGGKIYVTVSDRGIGIPAQEMPYIYEPFFRASNTSHYEGYGIGLPLARNIIRLHRGHLTVTSVVNKGTQVKIVLPAGITTF